LSENANDNSKVKVTPPTHPPTLIVLRSLKYRYADITRRYIRTSLWYLHQFQLYFNSKRNASGHNVTPDFGDSEYSMRDLLPDISLLLFVSHVCVILWS